eukprot:5241064-Amphidinium_carterae.1
MHNSTFRALEKQGANLHESEVIIARERDNYCEQLLAAVPQITALSNPLTARVDVPTPVDAAVPAAVSSTPRACTSEFVGTPRYGDCGSELRRADAHEPPGGNSVIRGSSLLGQESPGRGVPAPEHRRPLGQTSSLGYNPMTGMYGTDPPTPATTAMQMPAVPTPPGLPSHYSIATPPRPQSVACGVV